MTTAMTTAHRAGMRFPPGFEHVRPSNGRGIRPPPGFQHGWPSSQHGIHPPPGFEHMPLSNGRGIRPPPGLERGRPYPGVGHSTAVPDPVQPATGPTIRGRVVDRSGAAGDLGIQPVRDEEFLFVANTRDAPLVHTRPISAFPVLAYGNSAPRVAAAAREQEAGEAARDDELETAPNPPSSSRAPPTPSWSATDDQFIPFLNALSTRSWEEPNAARSAPNLNLADILRLRYGAEWERRGMIENEENRRSWKTGIYGYVGSDPIIRIHTLEERERNNEIRREWEEKERRRKLEELRQRSIHEDPLRVRWEIW